MPTLPLPFDRDRILEIARDFPTPFYIYDETAIRANARRLNAAFGWCSSFRNHFAVKATPNPHLLEILAQEGFGADCSSLPEILLAQSVGIDGEQIMFTSNDTPVSEFVYAKKAGAVLNLDDISHIQSVENHAGLPPLVSFRYNPGPLRQESGNAIIGNPEEAKYGLTRDQLFDGYRELKSRGVTRFGLHTMVVSNELNSNSFVDTARMLFLSQWNFQTRWTSGSSGSISAGELGSRIVPRKRRSTSRPSAKGLKPPTTKSSYRLAWIHLAF